MNGFFSPPEKYPEWNPRQSEFKFFWPLTEQIGLDLDYSNCETPRLYTSSGPTILGDVTGATWVTTGTVTAAVDTPSLIVQAKEIDGYMKIGNLQIGQKKPNFIRKLLFKLLGFDWEKK